MTLAHRVYPASTTAAPVIYVIDSADHPLDLAPLAGGAVAFAQVYVASWTNDLTPWAAPGLRPHDPAFGSGASQTLDYLTEQVVPAIEAPGQLQPRARGILGYSLAGLFALYAFIAKGTVRFDAVASLSGSLWYDGWTDYLAQAPFDGTNRFAYLSLGTKERRTANPRMRTVEEATRLTEELLVAKGCATAYAPGPGNHFEHVPERLQNGVQALAGFWDGRPTAGISERARA